jgi:hypothetical protein
MADSSHNTLEVHYNKSNFFRVIHMDGCIGGLSPRGFIHCNFYSERYAIPLKSELTLGPDRPVERTTEQKSGMVRELEIDVIMDINAALSFYVWFGKQLEQLRRQINIPDADWEQAKAGVV